jgi:hypothetical protein
MPKDVTNINITYIKDLKQLIALTVPVTLIFIK